MVEIYETYYGGAVIRIQGKDADGNWVTFWETDGPEVVKEKRKFCPEIKVSYISSY